MKIFYVIETVASISDQREYFVFMLLLRTSCCCCCLLSSSVSSLLLLTTNNKKKNLQSCWFSSKKLSSFHHYYYYYWKQHKPTSTGRFGRTTTTTTIPLWAVSSSSSNDRGNKLLTGILPHTKRMVSIRMISTGSNNNGDNNDGDAVAFSSNNNIPQEIRDPLNDFGQDILVVVDDDDNDDTNQKVITTQSTLATTRNNHNMNVNLEYCINQGYNQNPTITSTALAHVLWSHILRPGIDCAIDATAGNGGDSVILAKLLFPNNNNNNQNERIRTTTTHSKLISIDIQKEACDNTTKQLTKLLPIQLMESNVQVIHASHAPLPLPKQEQPTCPCIVALVVYNLGYLPLSISKKNVIMTRTDTTLLSMADAILCLRVGGMLSVMTYPRSNAQEDWAVHIFLEGLALFSSHTHDWREFVQTRTTTRTVSDLPQQHDQNDSLRQWICTALERVWQKGPSNQTWRVHEHRKLGWIDAPILLTAVRIK